ncbi:MAG: DUF2782 domain-containing protein [Xanthomonadaceae bacterium]|nr:DUF2782 domain-containing protein [Xanthomonadaceae bacterium]MDE1884355.1 DUF2782 domain-containing protein [Xanthomonadaceae bacterium]MDE2085191.1 DUF2782 domain-containing protein [Xanthomonadaceae bacterium]MDE2258196.1 DUF2782 domain-containing protein [Xanthomonadaceae bacterium]
MKSVHVLGLILSGVGSAAFAQGKPASDPLPPVQAPPSMNDPGVKAAEPTNVPVAAAASKTAKDEHALPPDVQAAANAAELPVVTVRQNGNETVEEYRKKGKLLFVRVLEKEGPTKFYVDNPAVIPPNLMQQLSGPSGMVQPVYYKLAEWK